MGLGVGARGPSRAGRYAWWALALVLAGAPAARGQGGRDAATNAAFQRGVRALDENRYFDAVEGLEEARRAGGVPEALPLLARAYRGLGRYTAAIEALERFLTERGSRLDTREAAQTRAELGRLRQAMPRVSFRIRPAITVVRVDGREVSDLAEALALDPGPHVVELSAPGFRSERRELTLRSGAETDLQLSLVADPAAAPLASAAPVASAAPSATAAPVASATPVTVIAPSAAPLASAAVAPSAAPSAIAPADARRMVQPDPEPVAPPREVRRTPGWVLPVAIAGGAVVLGGVVAGVVLGTARGATDYPTGTWGVVRE